jgi:GrpB-like predicted nucleotidyltransferase (UPF0157 family)
MAHQPITIVEYNEAWKSLYESERREIAAILEGDLIHIEHIGSTAIPGLAAKAVIDMMAGVDRLESVQAKLPLLAARGYTVIETGMSGRIFLRRETGEVAYHLHIVPSDGFYERNEVLLRDYLREHAEFRQEYADLKRGLAQAMGDNHAGYTAAKTEFIQKVVDLARGERGLPQVGVWEE